MKRMLCLGLLIAAPAWAQSRVVIRGGASPAEAVAVSEQGVTLATQNGRQVVVSWDRVAQVQGELADEAAAYALVAESMWRARARLERGDGLGAEPLFESLAGRYAGKRGPSAAVGHAGLLRCRLMAGAQTAAVGSWLSYINALGEGDSAHLSMPSLDPAVLGAVAVDGSTQLAPLAPPVWVDLPAVQGLARSTWPLSEGASNKALALQEYYRQAARFEAGLEAVLPDPPQSADEGIALVRDIVTARIGDPAQRAAARKGLEARLKKRPPAWMEVWCRVGLGRSLLREQERDAQLLGINELLEVAARVERVNPYLTGIALAESAAALYRLGDMAGAVRVRADLLERFGGHPALEWDALRGWSTAPQPAPGGNDSKGGSA
jgi:hypothetical protein